MKGEDEEQLRGDEDEEATVRTQSLSCTVLKKHDVKGSTRSELMEMRGHVAGKRQ